MLIFISTYFIHVYIISLIRIYNTHLVDRYLADLFLEVKREKVEIIYTLIQPNTIYIAFNCNKWMVQ